ncbi:MAG: OmpA/MotB family protein [Leadbetterella sp.]
MNVRSVVCMVSVVVLGFSCVSKKKFKSLESELAATKVDLNKRGEMVNDFKDKLVSCLADKERLQDASNATKASKEDQISDLKAQIADLQKVRDTQIQQMGGLTVLNQTANENINRTLNQLEKKDKYIGLLQAAKTKTDSLNLALAVNLKSALNQGIEDQDIDVKVDKTVVMVNLSDKMLFTSGSYKISPKAFAVLEKVAKLLASRPDLEMMVEGYTDNVAINTECIEDNWDLSVKRSASVVRTLQTKFGVDPNRLIASGRGEYNALVTNATPADRATNRRTRIILMPKLDQFYDLLNPDSVK